MRRLLLLVEALVLVGVMVVRMSAKEHWEQRVVAVTWRRNHGHVLWSMETPASF